MTPKTNEDNSAPMGLYRGEVQVFTPPPGLTDEEMSDWVDQQLERDALEGEE